MFVHQLAMWQHDIAERCYFSAKSLHREVRKKIPELPLSILKIPNHVHLLRALVDYCMANERRAQALLSVLRDNHRYLYQDLQERGPLGKTVRSLKQFKLTAAAEAEFGHVLRARMVNFNTFNAGITEVDHAFDIMVADGLLLPEEEFELFQINRKKRSPETAKESVIAQEDVAKEPVITEEEAKAAEEEVKKAAEEEASEINIKMQLFRDLVLPRVSAETRNSMMLILAVCNLHIFGVWRVSTALPCTLVEAVDPTAEADAQQKASNQEEEIDQEDQQEEIDPEYSLRRLSLAERGDM